VEKSFAVYILASQRNGTLYTGVTSDLVKRTWQHRERLIDGFAERYGAIRLVWYEQHSCAEEAIAREKRIKKWNRAWKIELIETANPYWNDLYDEIVGSERDDTGSPLSRG
jgi:putative endonuclease